MFSMQSVSLNHLIATFRWSSAASSLNLGQSQNGVLGNELTYMYFQYDFSSFAVASAAPAYAFLAFLFTRISQTAGQGTCVTEQSFIM